MHQNENKLQIDKLKLQQEETPQPSKEQEENHTSRRPDQTSSSEFHKLPSSAKIGVMVNIRNDLLRFHCAAILVSQTPLPAVMHGFRHLVPGKPALSHEVQLKKG